MNSVKVLSKCPHPNMVLAACNIPIVTEAEETFTYLSWKEATDVWQTMWEASTSTAVGVNAVEEISQAIQRLKDAQKRVLRKYVYEKLGIRNQEIPIARSSKDPDATTFEITGIRYSHKNIFVVGRTLGLDSKSVMYEIGQVEVIKPVDMFCLGD